MRPEPPFLNSDDERSHRDEGEQSEYHQSEVPSRATHEQQSEISARPFRSGLNGERGRQNMIRPERERRRYEFADLRPLEMPTRSDSGPCKSTCLHSMPVGWPTYTRSRANT